MAARILIVNYGMGNLNSIAKRISHLKTSFTISNDPAELLKADKIILPGVGHFGKAMNNLKGLNLLNALNEAVLVKNTPILGICLGMQLMANKSEEGYVDGLKWVDGEVVKFRVTDHLKFKVPHMGWNQIEKIKKSKLLTGIDDQSEFYFVHSYHLLNNDQKDILAQTEYCYNFTSAIEKNNIFGVQFHPEKSHGTGEKLLKNFIELI